GAATVDEDRALQLRKPGEKGPARDLGLGDKRGAYERAEHRNVEVGNVVRDIEDRVVLRRLADPLHVDAEQLAALAMIAVGELAREALVEKQKKALQRHQGKGEGKIGQQA